MNPTICYYLGLYLIVFVVRYFKLRKESFKANDSIPDKPKFDFGPLTYVSLEIVYTSAGLIIALIENIKEWIAPIVIFYIIIVLVSTFLTNMEEKFSHKAKIGTHLTIVTVIVIATVFSFSRINGPTVESGQKHESETSDSVVTFKVGIPYTDRSLSKNFGSDYFLDNEMVYFVEINAIDKERCIDSAVKFFWCDTTIKPFINKKNESKDKVLKIDRDNIIVSILN
jgi:hypothetical protein